MHDEKSETAFKSGMVEDFMACRKSPKPNKRKIANESSSGRPLRKGTINLKLVNLPVVLYSTEAKTGLALIDVGA
jgi:hypothetical protein